MYGDKGDDMIEGGLGDDTFIFNVDSGNDTIYDFISGSDVLRFSSTLFATVDDVLDAFDAASGIITIDSNNSVELVGVSMIDAGDISIF